MKMLMIICPEDRRDQIRNVIAAHDVHAYTEFQHVTGEGETGKRLDTHAWPGTSRVILTVVPDGKRAELLEALRECERSLMPGEGMQAFVLPVEESLQ